MTDAEIVHEHRTAEPPATLAPRRRSFGQRLLAALKLESALYEEVEHDPAALGHAFGVVVLAALATGVAAIGVLGIGGLALGVLLGVAAWLIWTAIVWLVGVMALDYSSDYRELLRTLGFVTAPQILYVLAIIPLTALQWALGVAVLVMTIVAFVRAVRQALDVDTGRALGVSLASVGIYVLVVWVVATV